MSSEGISAGTPPSGEARLIVSRRRRIQFSLLMLALAFSLMEGLARLFAPEPSEEPVVPSSIGRFDPQLGWSLRPGTSGVSTRTGVPVEYRINSQGLRDDETTFQKPPGVFRIVLLGDSRSFGYGVPIQQHFSRLLEGYFKNVEVVNLAVQGYGVDQELLSLRYHGFQYEPDLVMAYVAHYEEQRHMSTVRFGNSKPAFVLKNGHLELINSPVIAPLDVKRDAVTRWSRIKNVLKLSKIVRLAAHLPATIRLRNSTLKNPAAAEEAANAQNLRNDDYRRALLGLGEAIVFEMAAESQTHGAQFLLVTQLDQLDSAARAEGLKVANVSGALQNLSFDLPHDLMHFNEAGNGAITWEIARFLQDSGLIPVEHVLPVQGVVY